MAHYGQSQQYCSEVLSKFYSHLNPFQKGKTPTEVGHTQLRERHKKGRLRVGTMHVFSPSMSTRNALYRDRSHGDRKSLDNASAGACLKGVLIPVICSKFVTRVVQIFDETNRVYFMDTYIFTGGMRWCSWLRHCATSRNVVGSIPDLVIFIDIVLPAAL
jgi:hypothetical protein